MAEDAPDEPKPVDEEYQKLMLKWLAGGHEILADRRLYRHRSYKKDFPKGTVIKVDGVPLITPFGNTVTTDQILPERGDLCLDDEANVLDERTFAVRYKAWLKWFTMVENTDIDCEPIPDPAEWVTQTFDEFGESGGFVTIGYDARKKTEYIPTHQYDPRTDEMVEIKETQRMMAQILARLADEPEKRGPGRPPKAA